MTQIPCTSFKRAILDAYDGNLIEKDAYVIVKKYQIGVIVLMLKEGCINTVILYQIAAVWLDWATPFEFHTPTVENVP